MPYTEYAKAWLYVCNQIKGLKHVDGSRNQAESLLKTYDGVGIFSGVNKQNFQLWWTMAVVHNRDHPGNLQNTLI